MKFIKITLFLFSFISCQAQDINIKKCIKEKINSSQLYQINNDEKVHFFKAFQQIENFMFSEMELEDLNKMNYFKLFKYLDKNVYTNPKKKKYYKSNFNETLIEHNISPISIIGEINNLILNCFYEISNNQIKIRNQYLFDYANTANQIFANRGLKYELKDFKNLSNSLSEEQFNNILFRIPILMMIYENMNVD